MTLLTAQLAFASLYTNLNHGFSINFPYGWEESDNPDVAVLYTNVDGSASINVIVEETQLSLATYVSESKTQLEGLDYYELLSENSRTIGELNGYELVYAWTYFYDQENYVDLQDKQVYFVEKGKAFIITCGCNYSDYESYLPAFENSLESFSLMTSETLGQLNLTLIIAAVAIVTVVVLLITLVLLRRRRPAQRQFDGQVSETSFPPQPPPPSTK